MDDNMCMVVHQQAADSAPRRQQSCPVQFRGRCTWHLFESNTHPHVLRALCEKINKKNKNANVKPFMVKNHLWIFVNCQIENPAFDSQVGASSQIR
jgi:hypothetical protein